MKLVFLLLATVAAGAFAKPDRCFDFAERVTAPLVAAPPLTVGKVVEVSGVRPEAASDRTIHFHGARAWVPMTVRDATDWILDHTRWKEMEKTKLEVKELSRPGYDAFHEVHQDTRVFAFVHIQWVEEWAYALLDGSWKAPKRVLTSYQKVDGTSHIRRLCGSVEFRARGKGTDVFFYQEADADHYEVAHIQELHRRFLATLGAGRNESEVTGASR